MFERGDLVLISFPFSDLSTAKKLPVLMLTRPDAYGDFIALAVTSHPQTEHGIALDPADLVQGTLPLASWIRTDGVVTLNVSLIVKEFGRVSEACHHGGRVPALRICWTRETVTRADFPVSRGRLFGSAMRVGRRVVPILPFEVKLRTFIERRFRKSDARESEPAALREGRTYGSVRGALSGLIRKALREWLDKKTLGSPGWPSLILERQGVPDMPPFESYRGELPPPREDAFSITPLASWI